MHSPTGNLCGRPTGTRHGEQIPKSPGHRWKENAHHPRTRVDDVIIVLPDDFIRTTNYNFIPYLA